MAKRTARAAKKQPVESAATPHEERLAGANRAAGVLSIATIRFRQVSASTTIDVARDSSPQKGAVQFNFTRPETRLAGDELIVITTEFSLTATQESGATSQDPFVTVRATTELVYAKRPGADLQDSDLRGFAELNAPFNAWPFWREFVQQSFVRLGLPVFTLPLYRVSDAERLMVER